VLGRRTETERGDRVKSLDTIVAELDDLLAALDSAEAAHAEAIAQVAAEHRRGAVNLVHYTCLRQRDIRELQNDLLDLGATSLATTEADVRAKVIAARNVAAALRGDAGPWDIDGVNLALDEGDHILARNAEHVLGPVSRDTSTRIMVTLPSEAADEPALVESFVAAGMDIARINAAHDDRDAWARMARNVRAAAERADRRVLVSMDLPGPKVRTGPIADGPAVVRARITHDDAGRLIAPARIWLTDPAGPSDPPPPPPGARRPTVRVLAAPGWLARRTAGDVLTLTDARGRARAFEVVHVDEAGVLAEGDRNAYLEDGATISCAGSDTTIGGIPPLAQRLSLAVGDELVLTGDLTPVRPPAPGEPAVLGCTLPEALAAMAPGDQVLLDDGAIRARVAGTDGQRARLRIEHTKPGGQRLGAQKGINLPDTVLPVPALTDEDAANLPFVAERADLVAVSFIRTAQDVEQVLAELARISAEDLGLILKIETRQGFENLPSILLAGMRHPRLAVMIARGDLAVEVGFERLSEVPRQILALCEAGHVPTIWATQVLESMAKTGQPSRAEITDAAAGQRAECVMLNKGPHIPEAITALDEIVNRMGEVQRKSRTLLRRIHSWDGQ
jgi:pyruvate kinase